MCTIDHSPSESHCAPVNLEFYVVQASDTSFELQITELYHNLKLELRLWRPETSTLRGTGVED